MAYIKERGNNNYFVRVSYGILENGRPFQKSRLFRPSKVNLPESKVRKELDAFVKALEDECRIEFEFKHQHKPNMDFDEIQAVQELTEEAEAQEIQPALTPIPTSSTPLFSDFCDIYLTAKKEIFFCGHKWIKLGNIRKISNVSVRFRLPVNHLFTVYPDLARIGIQKPEDGFHCGGFTRTVFSDKAEYAAFGHRQIKSLKHRLISEAFIKALNFKHIHLCILLAKQKIEDGSNKVHKHYRKHQPQRSVTSFIGIMRKNMVDRIPEQCHLSNN